MKRSERGFLSGQRLPNAVRQHKHIGEPLARADFAVLDQGVDAVDHRGIARDVDDLFARVHGEGQWDRAVDLLGAVDKLSLAVDVLEGRAKDRLHRRAVARGDRRQPPRFLSEHVGARADLQRQRHVGLRVRADVCPRERGRAGRGRRHSKRHCGHRQHRIPQWLRDTHPIVPSRTASIATFSPNDPMKGPSMSANWGSVLTELIPLALVVALSPLSIIPAVLVLHTPRPRPTGLAFLVCWMARLAVLAGVFVEVSSLSGGLDKAPSWASWVRVVVGAALIVFGVFRWLTRKRSAHSPAWMRSITTATPARAAGA